MSIYLASYYDVVTCCHQGCGITFGVPTWWETKRRDDHSTWYCPNGHGQHFSAGTSDGEKLKAAEAREIQLKDQLQAAEAEAETRRAQLVRDRHRFANGVCPCCNRSFENVARHMKTKHPDYDPKDLRVLPRGYECSCGRKFDTPSGLRIHQGRQRGHNWADPKTWRYSRHLTVVSK